MDQAGIRGLAQERLRSGQRLAQVQRPDQVTVLQVSGGLLDLLRRDRARLVAEGALADELIALAGLRNIVAESGLDRWGSLSMETLLRSAPALLVYTGYRREQPSLANLVLEHPALAHLTASTATVTVPAKYWSCGLPASLESVELLQTARRALP